MSEVERLKAELEHLKQRLEEEGLYYRGELEASRRLLEDRNTRLQAAEVAKRRRAEDELAALKGELRAAREQAEANARRCLELEQALKAQAVTLRREAVVEQERLQQSVQAAWQSAEEEMQRLEQELARNRLTLAEETEKRRELEQRLREGGAGDDAALKKLLLAQKRALRQVDGARRAAEAELAELKAAAAAPRFGGGFAAGGSGSGSFGGASRATSEQRRPALQAARDTELRQDGDWAKVTLGEVDEEFNEEFLMTGADESLGEVQRLEAALTDAPSPSSPESARPPEPLVQAELSVEPPRPQQTEPPRRPATPPPTEAVDRSRLQAAEPEPARGSRWLWPVLGAAGALAAAALGWLLL